MILCTFYTKHWSQGRGHERNWVEDTVTRIQFKNMSSDGFLLATLMNIIDTQLEVKAGFVSKGRCHDRGINITRNVQRMEILQ